MARAADSTPIAGLLGFACGTRVNIINTVSDPDHWNLKANDLLHWEAIKRTAAAGHRFFDFGSVRYEGQSTVQEEMGNDPRGSPQLSCSPRPSSGGPPSRHQFVVRFDEADEPALVRLHARPHRPASRPDDPRAVGPLSPRRRRAVASPAAPCPAGRPRCVSCCSFPPDPLSARQGRQDPRVAHPATSDAVERCLCRLPRRRPGGLGPCAGPAGPLCGSRVLPAEPALAETACLVPPSSRQAPDIGLFPQPAAAPMGARHHRAGSDRPHLRLLLRDGALCDRRDQRAPGARFHRRGLLQMDRVCEAVALADELGLGQGRPHAPGFERLATRSFDHSLFVSRGRIAAFPRAGSGMRRTDELRLQRRRFRYFSPSAPFDDPFPTGEPRIVFTGAMDYRPNIDAVSWFARDVMPLLRDRGPPPSFWIVGANPAEEVRRARRPGAAPMSPAGFPTHGLIWPMRTWSWRPCGSPRNPEQDPGGDGDGPPRRRDAPGFPGHPRQPGHELLIADDAPSLARCVAEVLDGLHPTLGRHARRAVEARYDWSTTLAALDTIWQPERSAANPASPAFRSPGFSRDRQHDTRDHLAARAQGHGIAWPSGSRYWRSSSGGDRRRDPRLDEFDRLQSLFPGAADRALSGLGPQIDADRRSHPTRALVGPCRAAAERAAGWSPTCLGSWRDVSCADVPGRVAVPGGPRLAHVRQACRTVALFVLPGAVRRLHRALAADVHGEIHRFRPGPDLAALFHRQLRHRDPGGHVLRRGSLRRPAVPHRLASPSGCSTPC